MKKISYRRLSPFISRDVADFRQVFHGTPSYVYATGGRAPTDEEIDAMMTPLPHEIAIDNIFTHAVFVDDLLRGCTVVVRDYPKPHTAYLAFLLLTTEAQGQSLGPEILRKIEHDVKVWGCTTLVAAVDSENGRALKFWLREGFIEQFRIECDGFLGQAIELAKHDF